MKPAGWILACCNLACAGLQLFFFLPLVAGGKSLDVALWDGGPLLYRVDTLSLFFGVAWTLGLALAIFALNPASTCGAWSALITIGLLGAAYAREPVMFYVGWEVAGLGVWLAMPASAGTQSRVRLAALMYGAGLPLLILLVLGDIAPFVPPIGGVAQNWPLGAVILLGLTIILRTFTLSLYPIAKAGDPNHTRLLWAVYASTGPFLLAKALVEARWDAWGVWTLELAGTAVLLAIVIARWRLAMALLAIAVIGFGLAPTSPLAAIGAILLIGLGAFVPILSIADREPGYERLVDAAVFAGSTVGVWLVVQGALTSRYTLVGIIIFPAILLVASYTGFGNAQRSAAIKFRSFAVIVALIVCALMAIYPQAGVEWFARPIVAALAGGVGVSSGLVSQWGLGLVATTSGEIVVAALPATGIALAIFLAWAVLYWLRGLLNVLVKRDKDQSTPSEPQ